MLPIKKSPPLETQDYPDDFLDGIRRAIEKSNAYEAKEVIARQRNREEKQELVDVINTVLANPAYKTTAQITTDQVEFRADFITNVYSSNKGLTAIIYDCYFPKPLPQVYYHFTTLGALHSIVKGKLLRLHNLNKRFSHEEFVSFYRDHGMDGYDAGGTTFGVPHGNPDLMDRLFYISFTSRTTTQQLWSSFGEHGEGVRLGFEVDTTHPDFRQVYYSTPQPTATMTLVQELESRIRARWGVPLVFSTVSKIGAFYIKGVFSNESETRFLIKLDAEEYTAYQFDEQVVTVDPAQRIRYLPLRFESDFGNFKLVSVQPGHECTADEIEDIRELLLEYSPETKLLPQAADPVNDSFSW